MGTRMESLVLQVGISGPLVLALTLYTAARGDRSRVHRCLVWLLAMILCWMVGMVVQAAESPRLLPLGRLLYYTPSCFMSPLFLLTMLLYARVESFETHRAARWAVMAPFWFYLLAFVTEPWHGLTAGADSVLLPSQASPTAGPLFWSFQACSNAAALAGLGISVWIARTSPAPEERRRMWLLCAGAFVPLVTHLAYMFRVVPTDVPLTPTALGVTALILVRAIRRYRLLDVQPMARRDVIEASSDAVLIADADGRIVDLNPAAHLLLGGSRASLYETPLEAAFEALGGTEPHGALARMLEVARHGETPPVCEVEMADARILEASVGRPRIEEGVPAGYFVVLRDRTQERRAERMLQQSQKLESVGILAAGVAHEVNNPLAFVRANLTHLHEVAGELGRRAEELPKDLAEAAEGLQEVMEESITGLDRIQTIVQGLLRLSRTASEQRETCHPNAIVAEAVRFASLDRDPSVRLEMDLDPDLPSIDASPDQLTQVLLNLLLNARYALRDHADATIAASTRTRGDEIEIRVADNGPGVPEAIRAKIFDPFFTTRPPNEGTGLGLPIAFDIVRRHRGTLALEDSASGGACFVLRFPAARTTA